MKRSRWMALAAVLVVSVGVVATTTVTAGASVGPSARFLRSVDNMRNSKASAGAVTGLPDIPFVSTALVQQCSDQSFPMAPPQVICSTKDQHPQTFQPNVGRGYYYKKKYGTGKTNGVYIFGSDSKSARDSSF